MRFREHSTSGDVVAVTGVNAASFALMTTSTTNDALLGFAVERTDPVENQKFFMRGYKVFKSAMPNPPGNTHVSTYDQPVQSFLWDDFTLKPDRDYLYSFYPLKGSAKNLDRSTAPLTLTIHTEPLLTESEQHNIFFNRGAAASQAYERLFGSTPIDKLDDATRAKALQWLSRDLSDMLLKFIDQTQGGDRLLGCFYEFNYPPATDALMGAIDRGVDVQIIVDLKENDKMFPRNENLAELKRSGFPEQKYTARTARPDAIAHNKFMVLIRGGQPVQVWTGSTNLTRGGIAGQTNVGHWLRDPGVAQKYVDYWELLKTDPGGGADDSRAQKKEKNAAFQAAVEQLSEVPTDLHDLPEGTTPLFSPRPTASVLTSYAQLLDTAKSQGCITLAFGIADVFKTVLTDNTDRSALIFALLERQDEPNPRSHKRFIRINSTNNVYEAWGSYIEEPVHQWVRETTTGAMGLNAHVHYVHSKFMLVDPLGDDPIVVTGSANFSDASTRDNDENMLAIRGSYRAADIYFTEFNRLFNHYYFRSVVQARHGHDSDEDASLFLDETTDWQQKYTVGKIRRKRLDVFAEAYIPPAPS
jgi:phosphatidylserine/phosphatidylglycerophosphate/cardiolipin synthase-like enzyme